jgi:uncharacterized membrane protein YjgN (DUF898 family)
LKTYFDFTLEGRDWAGPFIGYWVIFLLLYSPILLISRRAQDSMGASFVFVVFEIVLVIAVVILAAVFAIIFLRIILPKLSIGGKAFSFKGSIREYLGLNIVGTLLTIITASIYFPWYTRRITAYLAAQTSFDGASPEFLSRGGKLFKYYLLCVLVPVIVVAVVVGVVFGLTLATGSLEAGLVEAAVLPVLFAVIIFVILIPFIYLVYKWYVNLRWNDVTIAWKTSFWPSCGLILAQVLLTVITASIYWPAGFLRIYGYFAGKTAFSRGDAETGRLGFDGSIGKGFGLIWGQTLLSIITLGIYFPWACAKIGRWLLGATFHQDSTVPAAV